MKILMGCPLYEGYGQTQNTVVATFQRIGDVTCGHVGGIVTTTEMKLMDIPEMNYTSQDKD